MGSVYILESGFISLLFNSIVKVLLGTVDVIRIRNKESFSGELMPDHVETLFT